MAENKSLNTVKKGTAKSGAVGSGAAKNTTPSVASENLRRAEENAGSMSLEQTDDGVENVAESEEGAGGLYTGIGKTDEKKTKGKGFFKRKGPISLIIGLVFGVGGFMGGAQLFQPFSLVEQFRETFNSMQTSANMRSNAFFNMQMESGRVKNPIKGRLFRADTFKLSNRQKQKLSKQGIDYDDDFEVDGEKFRVLKFDDGTGEIRIVAADDKTARALSDMDLKKLNSKFNSEAVSFKNLYENNSDFFNGYNKGSLTWRGAIANWFSSLTAKFLGSNEITRNLFQDFQKKVAESESGNTRTVALQMMAKNTNEIEDGGVRVRDGQEVIGRDEDGNEIRRDLGGNDSPENVGEKAKDIRVKSGDGGTEPSVINRASMQSESAVKAKLDDISGKMQKGVNIACTVLNFFGTVNMLISGAEALQIINLVTSYFEAIDKTKAGKGDESPIHDLSNALNETKRNDHEVVINTGVWNEADESSNFIDGGEGGIKTLSTETKTSNKTAMESSGVVALYGGGRVDPNDPSVASFNFTASMERVLWGFGTSVKAFEGCAVAKMVANGIGVAQGVLDVALCVLGVFGAVVSGGASTAACEPLIKDTIKGIALSVAIGVAIAGAVSFITPIVTRAFTRDLIGGIGGEDLGNALVSGANMYLGNTHRSNGGSLATREEYTNFALKQQNVIAENAKYERSQRSPFDLTSKYTFIGNLMTQMMRFLSVNTVMSAVTSTASTISSSIIALSPTVSAYDVVKTLPDMDEFEKTCPYLASIGAIGDAYCNPYAITDVSTIETDPADVINRLANPSNPNSDSCDAKNGNFLCDKTSDDGNVIIKADSDLAKYILFCDNRNSAFGLVDQNIANEVGSWGTVQTQSGAFNNIVNSAIGAIPIIGDTIDVVGAKGTLKHIGYISGESCVAGNKVGKSLEGIIEVESPNWNKAKYYQRFIEDQSLAETMGLIGEDGNGKSAVTAFLDDYYKEHPLDNSYEGILARYSGLEKDTVVAILDIIDYYNYIAQYDASERYAFGAPIVEEKHDLRFDNENQVAENIYIILLNDIEFADVRNRNFVV